jgi:hypothetical protein
MSVFNRLSFQLKLLLSFVLVIVLTTVAGYYLIDRDLIFRQILGDYYERTGSWNGVERIFVKARELLPFVLVDADGRVLINPKHEQIGEKVPRENLKYGVAIVVGGETVGTILPPPQTIHYRESIFRAGFRYRAMMNWAT